MRDSKSGEGSASAGVIDLRGIIVAAATPFDSRTGEVDLGALRENLARWVGAPIRGVLIGGSTGESPLLDAGERVALLKAARAGLAPGQLLIAGTGAESTRETIRGTAQAAEAGADLVLVQPPAYYRGAMDERALGEHYRQVAEAAPIPILLYQPPLRYSTIELSTSLIAELSHHPKVIGFKDSRGDLGTVAVLLEAAAPDFRLMIGAAGILGAALEKGATGAVLALASFLPGEACALHRAVVEGRDEEVARIQRSLDPVGTEIVAALGVPGVKAAMELLGYRGGPPRAPLRPLDAAGIARVRGALEAAGVL